MKRAKIMLTAITVLAIVGGALAFKAKTYGTGYCTTTFDPTLPVVPGNHTCAFYLNGKDPGAGSSNHYFYVTPTLVPTKDADCANIPCTADALITVE